jgi:AcrR family transcriptional regulator
MLWRMPIDVDVNRRLAEIAQATLAVVSERGADGVTLRAVAQQMGGSTTVVTNYLPTRGALLLNAIEHGIKEWEDDLQGELEDAPPRDHFAVLAHWAATTRGDDVVLRQLFFEVLGKSGSNPALRTALSEDSTKQHQKLSETATETGAPDPQFAADVVYLALRGFYLTCLENPDVWTSERVEPVIEKLVTLLLVR